MISSRKKTLETEQSLSPDMRAMTPIMQQYHALKNNHKDQLLFFRLGDFYELFFEDACIASKELDIVLTQRNKKSDAPIPMCGVPVHASDQYIARLIKKGLHVAICEQVEPESGHKPKNGLLPRQVVRVITPGTLTEDPLLDAKEYNFLLAVYPDDAGNLGVSWMDISTGDFFVETHAQNHLASVLYRLQPKEILVPESCIDSPYIQAIWTEWKKKITPQPASRFDQPHRRIEDFFNIHTVHSFGLWATHEITAAGALLDYALITQKRNTFVLSPPKKMDNCHFVDVDVFTRKNLELVRTFSGEKNGSLLHSIDHTVTPMGARLLYMRLTHPIKSVDVINERLNSVDLFVNHPDVCTLVRDTLALVPDVDRSLTRILLHRCAPKDLAIVRKTLNTLPVIHGALSTLPLNTAPEIKEAVTTFRGHDALCTLLNTALNDAMPSHLRDGNVIAHGYNADLDTLRCTQENSANVVADLQKKYSLETGISTLKIKHNSIIGHYIDISPAQAKKVPFHFVLKQSLVSSHRYSTDELAKLDTQLVFSQDAIRTLEERLFNELIDAIAQNAEHIRSAIRALAICDVSSALGHLAMSHSLTKPIVDDSCTLRITQGRHPVVEQWTNSPFVGNDCYLSPQTPIWLMTGPNMSGKSTFLRQNAQIILMAHIGSFVPAQSAHIGTVDRLFSRLGSGDELHYNRSTFMVEMIESSTILNQATKKSFVIFDEVGRGTSTYDGLAIAYSCLEYLADHIGCRTLFSTHYHELTELAHKKSIQCYTMKVKEWEERIVFLYQVIAGTSNGSYGLHVAKIAGMPPAIIHRATQILHRLESHRHTDHTPKSGLLNTCDTAPAHASIPRDDITA